jgi:hypothetical protein
MVSAWARTRARERIVALGEAGLDDRDLRRQILTVLGEVIAFDFFAWLLTDPVTAVGAAPLAEVPRMSELPASNRSSPRRVPVTASPCCHEPSAPGSAMRMTDP